MTITWQTALILTLAVAALGALRAGRERRA